MIEETIEFVANLTWQQVLYYFWPFFLLDMARYVLLDIVVLLKYIPRRRLQKPKYDQARRDLFKERPLVSVIVPGKNEGRHIPKLVQKLGEQTYRNIELVVVDDGSDDNTADICRRLADEGKIDCFIRNDIRGGKASAANTALNFSRGKYVVHLDADSHLDVNSIETILLPFYLDSNVGAVGGDIRVANMEDSFCTRLQAIEYVKSLSTGRTVSSELGILRIISGAYGAFRRDVLDRIHGWDVGPGLDGDITVKIRKLGFKLVHEPLAVCYTNVPVKFSKLAKQRKRWDRSLIRFRLRKHRDLLLPSASFNFANFFTVFENIFFNVILDLKWWIYITIVILTNIDILLYIFLINYALYLIANIIEYMMACYLLGPSLQKRFYVLALFLPLMPLYTGIYLRLVRTFAYLMETFHKSSYDDGWNPWKVSNIAKKEKL